MSDNGKHESKRDEAGRWLLGVSGKPAGRPKQKTISEHVRDPLNMEVDNSTTIAQKVASVIVNMAAEGNKWAIKICLDRTEDRVPAAIPDSLMTLPPLIILGRRPHPDLPIEAYDDEDDQD